jgi:hypothetical protein
MILVQIVWHVNPFRGERFAAGWLAAAEAVLDYGATSWGFYRAHDGRLDFIQQATFPTKAAFERYWYSETVAEARVELAGTYQVPLLPAFYEVVGEGKALLTPAPAAPS